MEYEFLGIDEGKQNLVKGNTSKGIQWVTDLSDYPTARAMQRLNSEQALIGYDAGYFSVDIASGKILHDCRRWSKVTSAKRQTDGTTLITGLDLGNSRGIWVVTLDENDRVVHSVNRKGNYVRLMETTEEGTFLLGVNRRFIETDRSLAKLREFKARGFKHAWKAVRLPAGTTLVSAGYGAFMARFDAEGNQIQKFGQSGSVPAEVSPYFYANFHFGHDGNLLVANWQGHGPNRGNRGRQLICFSPEGEYIDSWSFGNTVSSLQGLLVL